MPTTAPAFDLLWNIGGPKRKLQHQASEGVANLGAWFRAASEREKKQADLVFVLDPRDCALHATSAEATWYLSLPLTKQAGLTCTRTPERQSHETISSDPAANRGVLARHDESPPGIEET